MTIIQGSCLLHVTTHKAAALSLLLVITMQHLAATSALGSVDRQGNETDYTALLAIKSQLLDRPMGVLSAWSHSLHHCYWEGVICGHKHNRVIVLDLRSKGLVGTISPFIGNLSLLRRITLQNNNLHGQIPPEVGHLYKLQVLDLSKNDFTGEMPANLSSCVNLQNVSVGYNKLEGNIPAGFGALSNLKQLSVHSNNFTGPLFKVISNLTSLEVLSAAYNAFTGTIPESIGRMRNLEVLYLAVNKLSGNIPSSIFNLSSLEKFQLSLNQIHGTIPSNVGLALPKLKIFSISTNLFSGPLPVSMSNLTNLQGIDLGYNNFSGIVPFGFEHFLNLERLDFMGNNLEGDINWISSLVNCSNLRKLVLEANYFTGIIPKDVANLSTNLVWLGIGQNPLSGGIPKGISNLVSLRYIGMRESELTGTIPQDLGKLHKLEHIFLSDNRLTGKIPNSLGNLSHLTWLSLSDNKLQGEIPPSLGDCGSLLYMYLSGNELSGTLPNNLFGGSTKFLELYLSQNQLEGSIPVEINQQINLVDFVADENNLSGKIPDSFGKLSALQILYLDSNFLHDSVPLSFNSLGSLLELDLSSNNLEGLLPNYFSTFPLMYLNLSYNNFEGRVPTEGVFANVSAVSLFGNSRLCGGIPELHLPRCVQKEEKNRRLSRALMLALLIVCAFAGVLAMVACLWFYMTCHRRIRKLVSSGSLHKEFFSKVSYDKLFKATDGFCPENLLGSGAYGSVFRGILDGDTVAVKVLNLQHQAGSKSFMAECEALRKIRHRNLVRIITACSSMDSQRNDFKALVYEFMPNGSVDKWLHDGGNLSLLHRVDIAIDVAHALNYLHHECETPVVHCDLKPSNILLDSDMVAHVSDFGLAKVLSQPLHPNQSTSIGIRGTVGYAAPEYGYGSEASPEADLYSYGILLLELMTRKRPIDNMFKEDINLHMYAKTALPDQVLQIVDPALTENENEEADNMRPAMPAKLQKREQCMVIMMKVGVACSNQLPRDRMKISAAIRELQQARKMCP